MLSILFLAAVVLGGSGNIAGVILGAVRLAYLPERFRGFAEWRRSRSALALGAGDVFRPQGLCRADGEPPSSKIDDTRPRRLPQMPEHEIEGTEVLDDTSDARRHRPRATGADGDVLLEVDHVTMRFGGVAGARRRQLRRSAGARSSALIGPNGAGKTTCFNAITGVYTPTEGTIRFNGQEIAGTKPHKITHLGIARTFQNIRLFPEMTALENVMVGRDARHKTSVLGRSCSVRLPAGTPRGSAEPRCSASAHSGAACDVRWAALVGSRGRRGRPQPALRRPAPPRDRPRPGHRARAALLDEPAAGFNPAEKGDLMGLIRRIRDLGHTVLVIEHDMRLVLGVTDRIVVLEFGQKIAEGTPGRGRATTRRSSPPTWESLTMLLEMKDAVLSYGKIEALHGISVRRRRGRGRLADRCQRRRQDHDHASALSGVRGLSAGSIVFDGEDITKMRGRPAAAQAASCQAPRVAGIFPGMTVTENLDMGAYTRKDKSAIDEDYDRVFDLFPRLLERKKQIAGTMSGGEQQMLAIGRALMARPKLLMLDEPSMGLAPDADRSRSSTIITEITQQGTTILLVEQNAKQALSRSDRAYVLETGNIVKTGTGAELLDDPSVREAYLGVA